VTCVHVGAFPPTHNWAKILENCQAKKRPRLIQWRLFCSTSFQLSLPAAPEKYKYYKII
jgi:hypothetical protein